MKESAEPGNNKTGMESSKYAEVMNKDLDKLEKGYFEELIVKTSDEFRSEALQEFGNAGSIPEPSGFMQKLYGSNIAILMDKLGERLAFEKGGVRLYEMLLNKCRELDHEEDIKNFQLEKILQDEKSHVQYLKVCITKLGGDPTALTPGASASGVIGSGIFKIIAEPRATLSQMAEAILAAELVDNDAWFLLIKLAEHLDLQEEMEFFQKAYDEEQIHLSNIREWLESLVLKDETLTLH